MDANVLVKTLNMQEEEWLDWRRKGIGGSDAAPIMGFSKWKSPFQLYLEKVGEAESQVDNEFAYWGNQLEELVAKEFTTRTGKKVHRNNTILSHKDFPWMIANIDRMIVGEKAILECKTTNAYNYKEWEDDEIPEAYIIQVQHYMAVTGFQKAYIACLIGGNKFVWKQVDRDEELISMIIEAEKTFWVEHVEKRIPPPIDGSSAAEKFLKEKFEKSEPGAVIDLKAEYKDKIERLQSIKAHIDELEMLKTEIENQIKLEIGEAEFGMVGRYVVNWKATTSNRVDSKVLKKDYPDIYNAVCKPSISRRFEIKEVK
jgi:putative phage-type endonuclease